MSTPTYDFYVAAHSIGSEAPNYDLLYDTFLRAFRYNRSDAMALAFHMRDIRGGWGQREAFRVIMQNTLSKLPSSQVCRLIPLIPEYGRWDDLLLLGPDRLIGMFVCRFVRNTFEQDMQADQPSQLGKFLPSENASSESTKTFAEFWIVKLMKNNPYDMTATPKDRRSYRRCLSKLRAKLNIVERLMSAGNWGAIDYDEVPAKALRTYWQAFMRHDGERFSKYIADQENRPPLITPQPDMSTSGMATLLSSSRLSPIYEAMKVTRS